MQKQNGLRKSCPVTFWGHEYVTDTLVSRHDVSLLKCKVLGPSMKTSFSILVHNIRMATQRIAKAYLRQAVLHRRRRLYFRIQRHYIGPRK